LDNALQFSSPGTTVQVRSFRVDQGVVIEIEDQGLGIPAHDLARFNQLLSESPTFNVRDLGDASQLGFWVIASLARALDGRVHLRDSPYGGVRAIVLLPRDLFVESVEQPRPATDLPPAYRQAEEVAEAPLRRPDPEISHDQTAPVSSLPLPQRRPANDVPPNPTQYAAPYASTPMGRHTAANSRPSPRPVTPPPPDRPGTPELPVRERGSSLAPELRESRVTAGAPASDGWSDTDPRSSDDVRRSLSSFQEGTRRGRDES
jgi:hypothetical protein